MKMFQTVKIIVIAIFITLIGLNFSARTSHMLLQNTAISIASTASFSGAVAWVQNVGYFLIFIAMLIEGPIVTAAASFAVALGHLNLWLIFILSILGDLVADIIYYFIGYFSRITVIEKYGKRFGLTPQRIKKIEKLLNDHPVKTLLAIKLAPVIPTPGLMIVGTTKMPIRQYTIISLSIIIPKTIIFMLLGYYFGYAYDSISHYINNTEYIIVAAVLLLLIIYYGYQKLSAYISKKIETI